MSSDISCDVVIVGAGITGALCSYNFTKSNINTVLVEKNIIGYESTRANTALVQYEIDRNLIELQKLIGYDNAVAYFKESAKALLEIGDIVNELDDDCDFVIKDCLFYSYKDAEKKFIKEEYDQRKQVGFDVEYFDESSTKEKFSFDFSRDIF